jgi:hypothetical protein
MGESDQSAEPPVLAYATPSVHRGYPVLGAIVALLGACTGLFGSLMLLVGIPAILDTFTRDNSRDFPGDLFECSLFLLIGFFCLYIAVRWCRAVRGIFTGK